MGDAMATDEPPEKSEGPSLEPRENREPDYGDDIERDARRGKPQTLDNRAFYLIEREAIQLRRLRWEERRVRATPADAVEPQADRLAQYSRPSKPEEPDSVLTRSRKWVESLLKRSPGNDR